MNLTNGIIVSALMCPDVLVIGTVGRIEDNLIEVIRANGTSAGSTPRSMVRVASTEELNEFYRRRNEGN